MSWLRNEVNIIHIDLPPHFQEMLEQIVVDLLQ